MKHETIAKRLQLALSNANISQRELSVKAGIAEPSVSHYINGTHAPSNISAQKMGDVLNVNPLWLMGFDAPMHVAKKENFDQEFIKRMAAYYALLNQSGQEKLLAYAEDLISMPKYIDSDNAS